jgi:hypothetical protein
MAREIFTVSHFILWTDFFLTSEFVRSVHLQRADVWTTTLWNE